MPSLSEAGLAQPPRRCKTDVKSSAIRMNAEKLTDYRVVGLSQAWRYPSRALSYEALSWELKSSPCGTFVFTTGVEIEPESDLKRL